MLLGFFVCVCVNSDHCHADLTPPPGSTLCVWLRVCDDGSPGRGGGGEWFSELLNKVAYTEYCTDIVQEISKNKPEVHRKNWAVLEFMMQMQRNTITEVNASRAGPCSGGSIVLAARGRSGGWMVDSLQLVLPWLFSRAVGCPTSPLGCHSVSLAPMQHLLAVSWCSP